jgi:hypothetical protein
MQVHASDSQGKHITLIRRNVGSLHHGGSASTEKSLI